MSSQYTILGLTADAQRLDAGLYLVSTPIGNLRDITLRALETLAAADTILAEDKRVTKVLLAHYGISTPIMSYHEHNAEAMRPQVIGRLQQGAALALVSDAGTPLVSDPGFKLVEAALEERITVTALPGASAVLAALVMSGLPSDRFFFEGFLPARQGERKRRIRELETVPGTLVFFEAPHRLTETLQDMADVLGARSGAVARELTKKFETMQRGLLADLARHYSEVEKPRGEIVILVGPDTTEQAGVSDQQIDVLLAERMQAHSARDAAAMIAAELGLPRRRVYARALLQAGNSQNNA